MSKTLVERLRGDQFVTPVKSVVNVMHEAADRIEALQSRIEAALRIAKTHPRDEAIIKALGDK